MSWVVINKNMNILIFFLSLPMLFLVCATLYHVYDTPPSDLIGNCYTDQTGDFVSKVSSFTTSEMGTMIEYEAIVCKDKDDWCDDKIDTLSRSQKSFTQWYPKQINCAQYDKAVFKRRFWELNQKNKELEDRIEQLEKSKGKHK